MNRSLVIAVGLALLLGGAIGFVARADKSGVYAKDKPKLSGHHHSTECTTGSLSDSYGVLGSGFYVRPDGSRFYAANLVLFNADGKGNVSASDTVMPDGGPARHRTYTATYTVNRDCTGEISAASIGVHLKFALTNEGQALSFIQTDPGSVFSGRGGKTPHECDNSMVEGAYGGTFTGVVGPPAGAKLGAAAWAQISAVGEGSFSGFQITSVNGQIINEDVTGGIYSIEANCHGSTSSSNAHSEVILIDDGAQVLFLATDPGTVLAGVFRQQ
jgi:hypothetical protein